MVGRSFPTTVLLLYTFLHLTGCAAMLADGNQSLLDDIIAMNRDVQRAAIDEGAMERGNEIVAEARGIASLSAATRQEDTLAEQTRVQASQSYDSLEARLRDARTSTAAVIGHVQQIDKVHRQLVTLEEDIDLQSLGIDLITRGLGQLLSIAGVPFAGAAMAVVSALLPTAADRRIDLLTDVRQQLGNSLVYWANDMNSRADTTAHAIEDELARWTPEQRARYDAAHASLVADDTTRLRNGEVPHITSLTSVPVQPDQLKMLTSDAQQRAETLLRAFGNDLDEFYVAPTTEQIDAQPYGEYGLKLAAALKEARILAAARVRMELQAIYDSAYWSARYYERQLQALATLRDEPTLVSRRDPENPGQTLPPRPATVVLREDEDKLVALHGEMRGLHAHFGCSGGL